MIYPSYFNSKNSLDLFGLYENFNFLKDLYLNEKLPKVLMLSGNKGSGKSTLLNHFIHFIESAFDKIIVLVSYVNIALMVSLRLSQSFGKPEIIMLLVCLFLIAFRFLGCPKINDFLLELLYPGPIISTVGAHDDILLIRPIFLIDRISIHSRRACSTLFTLLLFFKFP